MIVNNFDKIIGMLSFESEDDFYHLQILMRKKDLPEHKKAKNNNARCIKTYYIKSKEYLLEKKEEIITLCHVFTARAYINLNKKSFKKAAILTVAEITSRIVQNQEQYIYRAYESVVGDSNVNIGDKKWIVDVDTKNLDVVVDTELAIEKCQSSRSTKSSTHWDNLIDLIPTVNGYHIITHPFNVKQIEEFRRKYPFDIQKNNPTLLYFNDGKSN